MEDKDGNKIKWTDLVDIGQADPDLPIADTVVLKNGYEFKLDPARMEILCRSLLDSDLKGYIFIGKINSPCLFVRPSEIVLIK